jgi:hypothetical protein
MLRATGFCIAERIHLDEVPRSAAERDGDYRGRISGTRDAVSMSREPQATGSVPERFEGKVNGTRVQGVGHRSLPWLTKNQPTQPSSHLAEANVEHGCALLIGVPQRENLIPTKAPLCRFHSSIFFPRNRAIFDQSLHLRSRKSEKCAELFEVHNLTG